MGCWGRAWRAPLHRVTLGTSVSEAHQAEALVLPGASASGGRSRPPDLPRGFLLQTGPTRGQCPHNCRGKGNTWDMSGAKEVLAATARLLLGKLTPVNLNPTACYEHGRGVRAGAFATRAPRSPECEQAGAPTREGGPRRERTVAVSHSGWAALSAAVTTLTNCYNRTHVRAVQAPPSGAGTCSSRRWPGGRSPCDTPRGG